jgi:uncharacterized protein YbaP (TraB family)
MKKILLVLGVVFISIIGNSQLLHSITKAGSTDVSYLYGTIHMGDSVLLSWDDTFLDAFYSCDVVVGEIDFINENTNIQTSIMEAIANSFFQPSDITSNEDTLKLINDILSNEFDAGTAESLTAMKPFWAMLVTEQLRKIKQSNFEDTLFTDDELSQDTIDTFNYAPIDLTLQYMAQEDSMGVGGLETMQSQVDLLASLGNNVTWAMYYDYLTGSWEMNILGSSAETQDIREMYLKQDLEGIFSLFESSEMSAEFHELAFTRRNENMHIGMLQMMSDHRSYFFAVGAGHLVGEDGLIKSLEKSGYIVTPVPFVFLNN